MLVAGDVLTCVNAMEEGGCTGILLVADVSVTNLRAFGVENPNGVREAVVVLIVPRVWGDACLIKEMMNEIVW